MLTNEDIIKQYSPDAKVAIVPRSGGEPIAISVHQINNRFANFNLLQGRVDTVEGLISDYMYNNPDGDSEAHNILVSIVDELQLEIKVNRTISATISFSYNVDALASENARDVLGQASMTLDYTNVEFNIDDVEFEER